MAFPRKAPDWLYKPLSRKQEVILLQLAAAAFAAEVRRERVTFPTGISKSQVQTTWRHGQQQLAVRKTSLKDCNQADYRKLAAHFESLLDSPAAAASAFSRLTRTGRAKDSAPIDDTHEARELRLAKIRQACESCEGFHFPQYPEAICKQQFRLSLREATAAQLQAIFFTVTQRVRAKLRKGAAAAPPPAADPENCPF